MAQQSKRAKTSAEPSPSADPGQADQPKSTAEVVREKAGELVVINPGGRQGCTLPGG